MLVIIKSKLFKLSSIVTAIILILSINIIAEEEKKDEGLKFPGKFNLEYRTVIETGVKDAQSKEVADLGKPGGNGGEVYMRPELKAGIIFTPLALYNIGVWLKDRVDLRLYDLASTDDYVKLKVRNRFYAGLDNIFIIDNVMTISAGFEFRLNNDLNSTNTVATPNTSGGIEVRLSPTLTMSGKYNFGLSWRLSALFEFSLYPTLYKFPNASVEDQMDYYGAGYWGEDKNKLFQKFNLEIEQFMVDFEFFHFFAPKEIKCALTYNMYLFATVYNPDYQNQYNDHYYSDKTNATASVKTNMLDTLKQYIGLNFDLWGMIKPYAGFYCLINQVNGSWKTESTDPDDFNTIGVYTEFRPGLKAGINFKKEWLEIGIGYTGVILTSSSDPLIASQILKANGIYAMQSYNWENFIFSYLLIKL